MEQNKNGDEEWCAVYFVLIVAGLSACLGMKSYGFSSLSVIICWFFELFFNFNNAQNVHEKLYVEISYNCCEIDASRMMLFSMDVVVFVRGLVLLILLPLMTQTHSKFTLFLRKRVCVDAEKCW